MSVEQMTAWRAEDGSLHATAEEAEAQSEVAFIKGILQERFPRSESGIYPMLNDYVHIAAEAIAETLAKAGYRRPSK